MNRILILQGGFYYPPQLRGDEVGLHEILNITVNHAGGEAQEQIAYEENANDWAFVGEYKFEAGGENVIRLNTSNSDLPFIADAVLLVSAK